MGTGKRGADQAGRAKMRSPKRPPVLHRSERRPFWQAIADEILRYAAGAGSNHSLHCPRPEGLGSGGAPSRSAAGHLLLPPGPLLPLNRGRGFAGDIVDDAVDAANFVDDAVGDFRQQGVGKLRPVGGHEILGLDGA